MEFQNVNHRLQYLFYLSSGSQALSFNLRRIAKEVVAREKEEGTARDQGSKLGKR